MISKVPGLPDAPEVGDGPYHWAGQYFLHGPRLLEYLQEMKDRVLSHYDTFTVGETPGVTTEHAIHITHEDSGTLNMLFQFEHMDLALSGGETFSGKWQVGGWELLELKQIISRWQSELAGRGWNSFYLSNHDQPRSVSRFGDDGQYRVESAKMLATFLHLLHGTPYIYQGEEIGMTNVAFHAIGDYRDIETLNFYQECVEKEIPPELVMAAIHAKSRDNSRTPMQWNSGPHAGFTEGTPWINVNPNYTQINVESQLSDQDSVLNYYRRLIALRREHPIVTYGSYELLLESHEQIYAYLRSLGEERWLVILNFSREEPVFALPSNIECPNVELLLANYPVSDAQDCKLLTLRPYEARVCRLAGR
jgi:oligo-1,6-glucosidase